MEKTKSKAKKFLKLDRLGQRIAHAQKYFTRQRKERAARAFERSMLQAGRRGSRIRTAAAVLVAYQHQVSFRGNLSFIEVLRCLCRFFQSGRASTLSGKP